MSTTAVLITLCVIAILFLIVVAFLGAPIAIEYLKGLKHDNKSKAHKHILEARDYAMRVAKTYVAQVARNAALSTTEKKTYVAKKVATALVKHNYASLAKDGIHAIVELAYQTLKQDGLKDVEQSKVATPADVLNQQKEDNNNGIE